MNKGTTRLIGGIVGALAGILLGSKFATPANIATTEIIDKLDSDDDDVNALAEFNKNSSSEENLNSENSETEKVE